MLQAKSENENSVYQLPERSSITMTEYADKFFQEDSTQKYKENEKEGHSRIMELNSSKSIVYEDRTIMEEDQQEALTEDEETLKQTLITSQNFLNVARSLFQIDIPVNMLRKTENVSPDKDARLIIDCGYELLKRKSKREVPSFFRKRSLAPSERRSIDVLIKEVNADLESLKYRNYTEGCDYDLADWLNKTIEKDIQNRHPDINCLWDVGWENNIIACLENNEIVKDVEKNVLNGLLNELSRDLLNVSISIF